MIEPAGEQTDVAIFSAGVGVSPSCQPTARATFTVGTVGCCGGGSSGASPLPALIGSSDLPAQADQKKRHDRGKDRGRQRV